MNGGTKKWGLKVQTASKAEVRYAGFPLAPNRIRRRIQEKKKIGKCGPCPVFASYTLAFALQMRKKQVKT
jgi:hypothetical protein